MSKKDLNKYIIIGALVLLLLTAKKVKAAELIAKFEGLSLKPYLDTNGKYSIGYGTQYNWDAKRYVVKEDRITKEKALEWLNKEIDQRQEAIKKLIKVPVTSNQLSALTSLAYNIGLGLFQKSSILSKLNLKDYKGAADAFLLYNKARKDGVLVVNEGLTNRRRLERDLFLK